MKNLIIYSLLNIRAILIKNLIIKKFPEVFNNKLRLYKGEEIRLVLTENTKPKFYQPRTVPLSSVH